MLINRSDKLALIHLAKKECGLDDEAYRAVLAGSAQVSSSAEIDTDEQFDAVMTAFTNLGFTRKPAKQKRMPVRDQEIPGVNRATKRQLYYIKGLWELASRSKDEKSLKALVKRIGKVDDLRFLPRPTASKVILALRDICWKAGFNPDGPLHTNGTETRNA
jgi:phage gp16-like protein